jgi:hypothetical protein
LGGWPTAGRATPTMLISTWCRGTFACGCRRGAGRPCRRRRRLLATWGLSSLCGLDIFLRSAAVGKIRGMPMRSFQRYADPGNRSKGPRLCFDVFARYRHIDLFAEGEPICR